MKLYENYMNISSLAYVLKAVPVSQQASTVTI